MIIKRVLTILSLFLIGYGLMAASPYAVINYAEGTSFLLIRDGKTSKILVDSPEVLGMELNSGDILQTSTSTFLEISIKSISATVQVAENTSFKCDVDASGVKVSGELYYGRVRAKVSKLAGASTFHIATPSLVAGVRGTNFGCDAIATRPQAAPGTVGAQSAIAASGAASAPNVMVITNRVFCFEGSVAVDEVAQSDKADKAVPETIMISPNEMVEKDVAQPQTVVKPLQKIALDPEINAFWEDHPITATESPVAETPVVVDPQAVAAKAKAESRHMMVSLTAYMAITLLVVGTTGCVASYVQKKSGDGSILNDTGFKSGITLIGIGSAFALLAAIFR